MRKWYQLRTYYLGQHSGKFVSMVLETIGLMGRPFVYILVTHTTVEIGIHQALLIIIQFFTNVFVFHTTKTVGKLLRSPLSIWG